MIRLLTTTALLGLVLALPVRAATPIDERRPANGDIHLRIENVAGRVEVRAGAADQVTITGSLGEGSRPLVIDGDRARLSIRVEPRERGGWGNRVAATELRLTVPAGARLEIDTVSANIDVDGIGGRDLDLESVSGSIDYAGDAARVSLKSVSGRIEGRGAGRDWTVGSVSGSITLPEAAGTLRVESVSGRIELGFAGAERARLETVSGSIVATGDLAAGGSLAMQSVSGSLQLTLAGAVDARIRAKTFSGRIESAFGTPERGGIGGGYSLATEVGAGSGDINLESFSGRIRIAR